MVHQHHSQERFLATSRSTTWLVVLLILEMAGMTWYTLLDVQDQLEPRNLVDRAEQSIRENYPQIRDRIKQEVETNSDEIAEEVSQSILDSSPQMRQWLEQVTGRQLAQALDGVTELSADQFRVFLNENRQQVIDALERLEEAPGETGELIKELESELDELIGSDLREQSRAALRLHRQLNRKLERLSSDAPLEPKELLERRIVRILRTLQDERIPVLSSEGEANATP